MFSRLAGLRMRAARHATPLLAGAAAAASCVAAELFPPRSALLLARCDAAPEKSEAPQQDPYPFIPPKLDDPERNSEVLESWRAKIQEAREQYAKLDVSGAERTLQLALEEAGHFGQSSGPVATSLLNLAQLYRRAGRSKEAEPLLVRAIDVLEQTAGPNNKVTLVALLDLAGTHLDLGKHKDAIAGFEDALSRLDIAEQNQQHSYHIHGI